MTLPFSRPLAVALALAGVVATACAHRGGADLAALRAEALRGLPARQDPPIDLHEPEDRERARAELLALDPGSPERAARRRPLAEAYATRIARHLDAGAAPEAFAEFERMLTLWDARELAAEPVPDAGLLQPTAERILETFVRTGSGPETIAALAALIATDPARRKEHVERFEEVAGYLDSLALADPEQGEGFERARPIAILEELIQRFPSPWVGETLLRLYDARQDAHRQALQSGSPAFRPLMRQLVARSPTRSIILVHAALGRLADAPRAVDRLEGQTGDEPAVRERLRAAIAPTAKPADWMALVEVLVPDRADQVSDPRRTLFLIDRICVAGARRFPRAAELRRCAGETAAALESIPGAIRWLEEAYRLEPKREVAGNLLRLTLLRMEDALAAERLDAAEAELRRFLAFREQATKALGGKPLTPTATEGYVRFARGAFQLGEIARAQRYLETARKGGVTPEVLEQEGTIALKRGDFERAATKFEEAAAAPRDTPMEERLDRARLRRLAADAHAGAGALARARELWQQALDDWDVLSQAQISRGARARAQLERGRILHALGRPAEAREAFESAIDLDPDSSSVYADAIAFLLTRGYPDAAADAYHRALGRPTVTDYFKVYTSLWIVGYARLRHEKPDPLAVAFLEGRSGDRWYDLLARRATGRMERDALEARADTRGRRAELYFYEGLAAYAAGERRAAERMLRLVLATDMLGFFEYEMADQLLRNGPPRAAR